MYRTLLRDGTHFITLFFVQFDFTLLIGTDEVAFMRKFNFQAQSTVWVASNFNCMHPHFPITFQMKYVLPFT